jgi:hypothetical protein
MLTEFTFLLVQLKYSYVYHSILKGLYIRGPIYRGPVTFSSQLLARLSFSESFITINMSMKQEWNDADRGNQKDS